MNFLTVFDTRVAGIPCQIGVLNHERHAPIDPRQAHSDVEAYGYTETDYVILDRRGRPAPWLTRKVKDDSAILSEIHDVMEAETCDY